MDKEKFVRRVENMIYYICGCDYNEAKEVLEECLRRNKQKIDEKDKRIERR